MVTVLGQYSARGDYDIICLSRYSDTGEELSFRRVEIGKYSIRNAVQLGEGYLLQLENYMDDAEPDRLVKNEFGIIVSQENTGELVSYRC